MKFPFNLPKGKFIGICCGAFAVIAAVVIVAVSTIGGNTPSGETPGSGTEQSESLSESSVSLSSLSSSAQSSSASSDSPSSSAQSSSASSDSPSSSAQSSSASSDSPSSSAQSSSASSDSLSSSAQSSSVSSHTEPSTVPHTHEFTETVVEPTCQSGGYTVKKCACGYSETYSKTEPSAHTFGEWIVQIQPTTETRGYRERFCTVCNEKEHEDLEKLEPVIEAASWNEEVLRLVNIEREKEGAAPLSYAWQAQEAADIRAAEIVELFDHTRPNGTACFTALNETGVDYGTAGENIAFGYASPAAVVQGWMDSPGHRANILNTSFTQLAVGIDGTYWVQMFLG